MSQCKLQLTMIIATVNDRKELQVLALMKAETQAAKKKLATAKVAGALITQAPHLGWNPFGL